MSSMSPENISPVQVIQQKFSLDFQYPVLFTQNCFDLQDTTIVNLIDNLSESPKLLAILDEGVDQMNPDLAVRIEQYCEHHNIESLPSMIVPAGEDCKNDESVIDDIYHAVEQFEIDRHSYILVVGGGAVVDAVGFAAATAHRGIRLIRMPSTVLGQNDAGVGVKNAVNYHKRKNFVGTFAPPFAVVNDYNLLDTLGERDKRAGIAEAIKVALIKDSQFFDVLYNTRLALAKFEEQASRHMIVRCAQLHLDHIATSGDPFELGSARPLDFGHWSAHKLEELSANELRHGEAVAIGIALDTIYSNLKGHLSDDKKQQVVTLLLDLGFELNHQVLNKLDIAKALGEFKEHLGGNLCITLLRDIGSGFEVNEIDEGLMTQALQLLMNVGR
ncbi:3-dehydroquinate synthase [Paraglaciecola aquimarina]|uniref:3-dehydroquinate synthase n=1 Tax=Paraglaciecola aquimarina TaxID=1235557 RepID=A0ABU3SZ42_9ALTE|nr:3-dehydroquinate synthase [Paraglaciecola aquimarina]MDU0355276.1 3-dehydroquinate synthase [Paraglaciecola aquimarina]